MSISVFRWMTRIKSRIVVQVHPIEVDPSPSCLPPPVTLRRRPPFHVASKLNDRPRYQPPHRHQRRHLWQLDLEFDSSGLLRMINSCCVSTFSIKRISSESYLIVMVLDEIVAMRKILVMMRLYVSVPYLIDDEGVYSLHVTSLCLWGVAIREFDWRGRCRRGILSETRVSIMAMACSTICRNQSTIVCIK